MALIGPSATGVARSSEHGLTMALQARITITGRVQGVGYRDWVVDTGRRLGLAGWVRNRRDGSVEAHVQGPREACDAFVERCRQGPPSADVDRVVVTRAAFDPTLSGFVVR